MKAYFSDPKVLAVFGGILTSVSLLVGNLNTWAEAGKPGFVAGVLLAVGTALGALHVDSPLKDKPNA